MDHEIGFKALSGTHSGENLGQYVVGLFNHVGIMSEKESKASCLHHPLITVQSNNSHEKLYTATLDNTGNNNTTC